MNKQIGTFFHIVEFHRYGDSTTVVSSTARFRKSTIDVSRRDDKINNKHEKQGYLNPSKHAVASLVVVVGAAKSIRLNQIIRPETDFNACY